MTQEKEKLVTDNMALAHHITKKYLNSSLEYDDIVAAAYLGLVKAALHFESSRGVRFSTFAGRVISNEILIMMRSEKKQNRIGAISLETPIMRDEGLTLEDVLRDTSDRFEGIENRISFKQNEKRLHGAEKKVFDLKLENPDITQEQIGERLHFSQSYISRVLKSIRMKMLETA